MASTIKIRTRLSGDVAEVKSLILHPMETGARKDPDTGSTTLNQVMGKIMGMRGRWTDAKNSH